jgi:hypothetical protein
MVVQERKALPPSLHGTTSGGIVRKEFIIDLESPSKSDCHILRFRHFTHLLNYSARNVADSLRLHF